MKVAGPFAGALLLLGAVAAPAAAQGPVRRAAVPDAFEVPAQVLGDIDFRMVGPSRGGRVTTVTGIPDQPHVFYMGSTGGGVWKTENAGVSWTNLSDGEFAVGSIGAVAVAPSDPNVVYVGTGSACPRGNISVGNGVYRSTDAGRSWTHVGLEAAGLIGRIVVDPDDPDRAFVAVLGQIFGRSPERGVYLTEDGGKTWTASLQISDATGAVELAMNPANPREIFAAMWQAERKPWTLIDGGAEGASTAPGTGAGRGNGSEADCRKPPRKPRSAASACPSPRRTRAGSTRSSPPPRSGAVSTGAKTAETPGRG